ncbi:hypothetical protein MBLNU230_g4035t1 [Neophaeotheca triangularis]
MASEMQRRLQILFPGVSRIVTDIKSIDMKTIQDIPNRLQQMNMRDTLMFLQRINFQGIMLLFVVLVISSMVLYAQFWPETERKVSKRANENAALGKSSRPLVKPGDPPIPPPTEVVSLRVYPIKSCRGFETNMTRLRKTGLTLDRNWMFVDAKTKEFLTIRGDPSMTLIDTNIIEEPAASGEPKDAEQMLQISIRNTKTVVTIPAFPTATWLSENTTLETVNIWEKDTDGYIYSEAINGPFSAFFNKPVALVYKGPSPRNIATNGREELYGQPHAHLFADVMSLQIASEASIKDLNRRLQHSPDDVDALTIERFRPNIIVRGRDDHPWEEDTWKRVRLLTKVPAREALYKIDLDVVARCARCQVPNVNPETAEKHAKQPWDELMKFRRVDQGGVAKYKPCFGMLCVPRNEGILKVGATLEVLETTDKHSYNTVPFKDL